MIYIRKRGYIEPTVYWTNGGNYPDEWSVSNTVATYAFGTAQRGNGVLHGPLLAEGAYVDVFLHAGYTNGATSNVSFLGATSSNGWFSYGDATKNYASVYWSGIQYVNGSNTGPTFQLNGGYYRISRTVGGTPGVNTKIRVSKTDANGTVTTAGNDMSIAFHNNMHVVLFGQSGYNNSSISWIRSGAL